MPLTAAITAVLSLAHPVESVRAGDSVHSLGYIKCGTPQILMQRAEGSAKIAARLALETSVVSSSGHFRVHYDTAGYNAPPAVDANTNGIPDYVDSALVYLDYAWVLEIETLGYPAPRNDNGAGGGDEVDVYIKNYGYGGYGETFPEQTVNGSAAAYIIIDNDYAEWQYATKGYEALKVTTAHEFFHVIQFSLFTDLSMVWWMEQSAVWMEDRAWDDVNDYLAYLYLFFHSNGTSLDSSIGSFMYGAGLWPRYLAKRFGENIVRDIWLQATVSGVHNVSILDDVIPVGLAASYQEFGVWNWFTSDRANPLDFDPDSNLFLQTVSVADIMDVSPATSFLTTNPLTTRYVDVQFLGDWGAGDALDVGFIPSQEGAFAGSVILYNSPTEYELHGIDGTGQVILDRSWDTAVLVLSCTRESGTGYSITVEASANHPLIVAAGTPAAFLLAHPYPNPFNPTVTLAFTLPGAAQAAVRVYNTAGQLVDIVADDTYAAGEHRLTWQPSGLASGTYLVSVETPAGRRTAKVLYVK